MRCLKLDQALAKKKSMKGNWDIINKKRHSTFYTGKPGNFNGSKEVI